MSFWFLSISLILILTGFYSRKFYIPHLEKYFQKSDVFFLDFFDNFKKKLFRLYKYIHFLGGFLSKKFFKIFKSFLIAIKKSIIKYSGVGIETLKESRKKSTSFFLSKISEIEKRDIEKDL